MEKEKILALIHREVVPALGCTEPIAVALASAAAVETLGREPEYLEVTASPNLLKNGMGVIVPGTGQAGLQIAAAVGACGGKSALGLECLRDLTDAQVEKGRQMLRDDKVKLGVADNGLLLYCSVLARAGNDAARAEIRDSHANLCAISRNGAIVFAKPVEQETQAGDADWPLSLREIQQFATQTPLADIDFILEAAAMNRQVAEEGLKNSYGLAVGKSMAEQVSANVLADDMATFAVRLTAAASDARMAGVKLPVMSNSGSGNQGVVCTMPVVACAMRLKRTEEELARALILSHLVAIHIKHYLGRLSAHCGVVIAATGASCGITQLMGGGYAEIENAVRNMIGNIAGMICDGAKSSCALKVASGVSAGIQAALLAMRGASVPGSDGIVEDDIEACIANLGKLGSDGMRETDRMILEIMLNKKQRAS
ncbi:MAG: serine dehydratase subunit alpha family protein [Desulfovibrio sp.]|nr:serine dehydratase subunit alpha family protein [Desulfovibrio sp.]